MPRLLPGRRASTAGGTVLKKQNGQRSQLPPPPEKDILHKFAVSSVPPVAQAKPTAANVVKMLGNEAARKQVETVLAKIEAALPYPTGATLNAIETDDSMNQTKLMLIKLAGEFADLVMVQVFALIEKLEIKAQQPNCPLANILDSQLYLLKMSIQALNIRWPSAPVLNAEPTPLGPAASTNSYASGTHVEILPRAPSPRASSSSLRSNSTVISWIEPPALEDATVEYMLHVLHPYLMAGGSNEDPEHFPWTVPEWEPSLAIPDRIEYPKVYDSQSFLSERIASSNGRKNPIVDAAREAWIHLIVYTQDEAEDEALHGSFFANVPILIKKYAVRVVYHLSASNWPVIFGRFKARIHAAAQDYNGASSHHPYLPASRGRADAKKSSRTVLPEAVQASRSSSVPPKEDNTDSNGYFNGHLQARQTMDLDLKLLGLCLLDKTRLLSVLREIILIFRDIPASLQDHAGVALRQAIINWAEGFPHEFAELWALHEYGPQDGISSPTVSIRSGHSITSVKGKMLDGIPERLFDMLFAYAKEIPKRAPALYPMLAVLLSICPEKLESSYQVLEGFENPSRLNNFLTNLEYALQSPSSGYSMSTSSVKITEQAAFAYLDMLRLSFILRNERNDDNYSLQAMGVNLAQGLKSYLLNLPGPQTPFYSSREPIDVNFYVYAIVAIFRFDPDKATSELLKPCLDPQRSLAVKLVAAKALIVLVVEAYIYPLQPQVDFLYPILAPRLGAIVAAVTFDVPEMVNGKPQPASALPCCKTLAAEKYNDTRSQMETVRLTTYFSTLFCYDTRFIMYGIREEEHDGLHPIIEANLSTKRDPKERIASILTIGLCFLQCSHAIPGTIAYKELIDHVRLSADFFMDVSANLLLEYSEDPQMARLGVRVLLIILQQIYGGLEITQDNSWRFSERFLPVYQHIEIAILSSLYCPDMAIIRPVLDCLCIMAKMMRNPAVPIPSYTTPPEYHKRYLLFEALGASSSQAIVGHAALQKRMRYYLQLSTVATPVRMVILRLYFDRFSKLLNTIRIALARQQADPNSQERDPIDRNVLLEWRNILFILATSIRIDVERTSEELFSEAKKAFSKLPPMAQVPAIDIITSYLQNVLELIDVENVKVRDAAKDALGAELNFKVLSKFLEIFDKEVQVRLKGSHSRRTSLFVEQGLFILKTLFERLDGSLAMFENNVPCNLVAMGRYIGTLSSSDAKTQQLRHLYCNTVNSLLRKRDSMAIRDENEFRHDICTLTTNWMKDKMPEGDEELYRLAFEAKLVTLKLFVFSVEYLHLSTLKHERVSGRQLGVATEVNDYIETLMRILPPDAIGDISDSVSNFDKISDVSETIFANEALVHDLVISGIAHLLNNNSESAKNICLTKISDKNLRIRVIFMKVFTRILNQGGKFDQSSIKPVEKSDNLYKLVRDTPALSVSIAGVCPPSRVEYVTPILMRIFDTRHSLVTFLKAIIDVELSRTVDASELLRSTNLRTRFTSLFAQKHGYYYLRTVVKQLIDLLMRYSPGHSFEIDSSSKLSEEDLKGNLNRLTSVTQEFIKVLIESCSQVPFIIREICHYMANAVSLVWPNSKYPALGAFVFLRFLGPAIVAPDSVNLILPNDRPHFRRALVNVARLVQVISNRNLLGRERLPQSLIPFVQKNTANINTYLTLIQDCVSSSDESVADVYSSFNEADGLGLRKYVDMYSDTISRALLEPTGPDSVSAGKEIWDAVAASLLESRVAIEPPKRPSLTMREHKVYQQFCERYRDHGFEAYEDIFKLHQTSQGPVLVIYFAKIIAEIIDFDLLLFAVLKIITSGSRGGEFDVIFDFTGFTLRSRLPIPWLKRAVELIPTDIQGNWRSAYIFNTNVVSQAYLRQVLCVFKDFTLARNMYTPSLDDLRGLFPISSTIRELTLLDGFNPNEELFEHVHFRIEGYGWRIGAVQVGRDYARVVSLKAEDLSPSTSTHTVELVNFHSVENIHRNDSSVVLRHYRGPSIILEYSNPEELWKALIEAKGGATVKSKAPFLPATETADTSAVLFAIGLIHACHHFEFVRNAAYELLTANCAYLGYPFDEYVPWRGSYIPSNPVTFISSFSDRLSHFAPHLTLDFISEWCRGFQSFPGLSIAQKLDCLDYLRPWISNLDGFAEPGSQHFNEKKLRNCIYFLVDITLDDEEVFPTIQRTIWMKIGQLRAFAMDIAIEKLTRIAIDYGLGSRKCEQAAETLMCFSSIHIQPTVLAELRAALSVACNKKIKDIIFSDEWRSIVVLTRLALVSGHSLKLAHTNQLCAGEIAYVVSMLAGIGTLMMRQSVWGMAVNLVQALLRCRSDDDIATLSLRQLYNELHERSILKLFGLDRPYSTAEMVSTHSMSQHIPLESVQKIVDLLTGILEIGSHSIGCSNVWKARWVGLVSSICFQSSDFSQRRGLAVLGSLTSSKVEEDVYRQMLYTCQKALSQTDYDDNAFLAILFCIRKSVPGVPAQSKLVGLTFWLAISLLQAGPGPHYNELLHLIEAAVDTMDKHGSFRDPNTIDSVLMDARQPIRDVAITIDKLSGLSFETDFGFSLVMALWNGVKNASEKDQLCKTMTALLKHSIRHSNPGFDIRSHLDTLSVRFFIGLTPCLDRASFCKVLKEECHVAGVVGTKRAATKEAHDLEDYEYGVKADMLAFMNITTTILATDILWVLETHPTLDVLCKENVMLMLAVIADRYPDQHAQGLWFATSLAKEGYVSAQLDRFFGITCKAHAKAFSLCLNNSITRAPSIPTSTPDATPNVSSTSLAMAPSVSSHLSTPAGHGKFLADQGMTGIVDIFKRVHNPDLEATAAIRRDILKVMTRLMDIIINIS